MSAPELTSEESLIATIAATFAAPLLANDPEDHKQIFNSAVNMAHALLDEVRTQTEARETAGRFQGMKDNAPRFANLAKGISMDDVVAKEDRKQDSDSFG